MSGDTKVVMFGSGGVGKSAITIRFVKGIFVEKYDPTVEDSYRKAVSVDDEHFMLEIVDTAGTEQFTIMRDLYVKGGQGFIIVYSVTTEQTFREVRDHYDHVISVKGTKDVPMVLVGNKIDLQVLRTVSTEEGKTFAAERKIQFLETSAQDGTNINAVFETLVRLIHKTADVKEKPKTKSKGGCLLL